MSDILPIRIPAELNERLSILAKETSRPKSFYVREALLIHLEEVEDMYYSLQRLQTHGKWLTTEELEKTLVLEN